MVQQKSGTEQIQPHHDIDSQDLTVTQLADRVRFHKLRYYNAEPLISDAEFDHVEAQLRALDPDHAALREIGAPLQDGAIGEKVEHRRQMLSLEKCNTADEFYGWLKGICSEIKGKSHQSLSESEVRQWAADGAYRLIATPKIDGLACSLLYKNGQLNLGATRGDGRFGENITVNARRLGNVPAQIGDDATLEVRGEVYLPLSEFSKVADQFANPRNLAAGMLKSKDQTVLPLSALRFYAYDLQGSTATTETARAASLKQLGFAPAPAAACQAHEVEALFAKMVAERDAQDFEADGVVFKFDDVALQARLGTTSHHPRGAIAYKFAAQADITTLNDVEWSVSRTGTVTPVALVAPVSLSGATVSRATLHNLSNVRRLNLHIGDTIEIKRRGGVIPHVEASRGGGLIPVEVPSICPSCGSPTREDETERKVAGEIVRTQTLMCTTPDACVAAKRGQLLHYCSTLEMEGFGDKVIDVLLENNLVADAADLYSLQPGDLKDLPRFGPLMITNLLRQVQKARQVDLALFLRALGVDTLGKHAAELLAARWKLDEILQLRVDELKNMHSLGEKSAQAIVQGLAAQQHSIERLRVHVTMIARVVETSAGPLQGEVIVFTGKLEAMGRRDAQQKVAKLGAMAGDSVTNDTTILVVGADEMEAAAPSSKLKKARKLAESGGKIQILAESQFWQNLAAQGVTL